MKNKIILIILVILAMVFLTSGSIGDSSAKIKLDNKSSFNRVDGQYIYYHKN